MGNQSEGLRTLAHGVDEYLTELYGERMGFFICVTPFSEGESTADFISNVERITGIEMLDETVKRLKKGDIIPVGDGVEH